ncbi:MAG: hypothetical protein SGBAC_005039 [Bacillariaceae sp.]
METLPALRTRSSLDEEKDYDDTIYQTKDDYELLEMNLPGLCNGEEGDDEPLESSQYRAAADVVSKENMRMELLNQVRDNTWFSQRQFAYQDHHHMPRRGSMNEESFSYAKALVDSDAELERFSKEISTQLHLTEMMEVAVRAQKAADEGCETFSARLSSFVPESTSTEPTDPEGRSDADAVEHYNGPLVATPKAAEPSPTSPPFRHIAEVVPNFATVNNHMRTHLYRKKVDKKTLVFKELKEGAKSEQNYTASPRSQGTEITADFFKNLSGYFGKRVRSQDEDDEEKKDSTQVAGMAGMAENDNGSLEEYIPLNMGTSAIPAVGSLASLTSLASLNSRPLKPSSTVPTIFTGEEGEASISTPPTSPTISNSQADDPVAERDQGSHSDSDGTNFSCPSSPSQEIGDRAPPPLEIMETVRVQKEEKSPKSHDFNTPKRLRILRQGDGGEPTVASSDHSRYNFSPGSIVASSVGAPSQKLDPLEEYDTAFLNEQTRLLEIPRIGEKPTKHLGDLTPSPTIHDVAENAKRTRRIRMLRRRLDDDDDFASETREGSSERADEETKSTHHSLYTSPATGRNDSAVITQCSSDVSLSARPQPEEGLDLHAKIEQRQILGSTSLCDPNMPSLMETTSVAGIPLILPSPSRCGDEKEYFKEPKNDEYMNNYFYLSRLGASERRDVEGRSFPRFICDETIDKTGILCQDVGATCNDLDHLFLGSNNEGAEKSSSSGRTANSQASGWWFSRMGLGFIYDSAEQKRIGDTTPQE